MENDRVIVGNVVEHYRLNAIGKINITFSSSRKHSEILNQAFLEAGIPSKCVDGETPDEERKKIFRSLARRELLNICNCELLTFGFDLSSAAGMAVAVESISVARPTQSTALWMQILGRALRYKNFPALIFDHSSNALRLGLPDDDREWTLKDRDKIKKGEFVKHQAIKQCPLCYAVNRPSLSCPSCGHTYEVKSREPEHMDGELREVLKTKAERESEARKKKEWNKKLKKCKTEGQLLTLAMMEGFKNPQAFADKIMETRRKWSMMI